jgi:hypothetical protein
MSRKKCGIGARAGGDPGEPNQPQKTEKRDGQTWLILFRAIRGVHAWNFAKKFTNPVDVDRATLKITSMQAPEYG